MAASNNTAKESEKFTDFSKDILLIAEISGDAYVKGKNLFHNRMLNAKYVPLTKELQQKLNSSANETIIYKDLVHDQDVVIRYSLFLKFTMINFIRPNSDTALTLYLSQTQINLFNNREENNLKLNKIISKIDLMITNTQKPKYFKNHDHLADDIDSNDEE